MIAWSLVLRFLRGIPWQLWAIVGALFGVWLWGHIQYKAGYEQRDQEAIEANILKEVAFLEKARAAERRHQDEMNRISANFIKEKEQNDEQQKRLVADLTAGTVRLRKQWQGCANRLPETGDTAGRSDEDAQLRAEGAAALVRLGAEADQWIRSCQSVIQSDRKE
jgi:hypothetical protein